MNHKEMLEAAAERARNGTDPTLAGTVDESLMRKARQRITGANLHEAVGLIARMVNHYDYLDRVAKRKAEGQSYDDDEAWTDQTHTFIARDRRFLMHFIQTGVVPSRYNNYCGLPKE
jgi:hypothetical protein